MASSKQKLVVIGGVAAGTRAAAHAKRIDKNADVTLVTDEAYLSYSACSFPYYIGRRVDLIEKLILYSPEDFEREKSIRVLARHRVVRLDPAGRVVTARDLEADKDVQIVYDKLLLATGASPRQLRVPGADLGRIFTLRGPDDALRIRETIEESDVRRVTVIGAGLIGIEVVDNLFEHRLDEITLIQRGGAILPMLDPDMTAPIERDLIQRGVRLILNDEAARFDHHDGRNVGLITTKERKKIETDCVILAIGVEPNSVLACEAGLALGVSGAIRVNDRMQTSDPHIFAAGDCVESRRLITGAPVYAPFGSLANRQGRVAGANMAGGDERFPEVAVAALTHAAGWAAGKTGLTENEAKSAELDFVRVIFTAAQRGGFAGETKRLVVKALAERGSRRLLGVQLIGGEGTDKRLDVATSVLQHGATVADLIDFEVAYHPLYSQPHDALNIAGSLLEKAIESPAPTYSAMELEKKLNANPGDILLVDVRPPRERMRTGSIAGALYVPLDELPDRAAEFPPDKEIIVIDWDGRLAHSAAGRLRKLKRKHAAPLDGGLMLWRGELI